MQVGTIWPYSDAALVCALTRIARSVNASSRVLTCLSIRERGWPVEAGLGLVGGSGRSLGESIEPRSGIAGHDEVLATNRRIRHDRAAQHDSRDHDRRRRPPPGRWLRHVSD